MAKFWTVFKKIILVWGFLSLAFVLYAVITLTISTIFNNKVAEQEQNKGFEKTFNDIKLKVTRKYDKANRFFVSVTKANTPLIANYQLPTREYDLNWIRITDAAVIPIKGNEYHIILYSAVDDCDQESGHYVWFLKLSNEMSLIKMISLSDIHNIEGNESMIFGNNIISLPSFTGFKYEQIVLPIEVRIGDTIKTIPMLNQRSIDTMRHYYDKEINARMAKLATSSNAHVLEQYKKTADELKEVLSENVYPY